MGSSAQTGCLASRISELWVCMGDSRNGEAEGLRIILYHPQASTYTSVYAYTRARTHAHIQHTKTEKKERSEKVAIDSVPSCILVEYEGMRRDFLIIF